MIPGERRMAHPMADGQKSLMTNLKDKVTETAEHVKNVVTETADKAKDIAVETAANIRRIGDKAIDKANGAVHAIGDRGKQARDKKKNGAPERKA
jgi:ElaB/YqjD/DUF883 family membrane-anchored ribosome-binding protein